MLDKDTLSQWIDVPDATVDELEGIGGLKNFANLDDPLDCIGHGYNEPSLGGLLLGPHYYRNHDMPAEGIDAIDRMTVSGLFPPPLSPDSSPASIASSTPWLRTPVTDSSFNHTPADAPWDIVEAEEPCSAIYFLDQSGNCLEDIPSQIYDVRPEDIACTPQNIFDTPLPIPTPYESLVPTTPIPLSTPIIVINSPLPSASTCPQTEAGLLEATYFTSLSPSSSSYIPQTPFGARYSREEPQPGYSALPQLIPPPTAARDPSPLISYSTQSPAHLSIPLSDSHEVKVTDPVSSASRTRLGSFWGKRSAESLDDDDPPLKMRRRSKTKNVDEEEWSPTFERVKRSRVVAPSSSRHRATSVPNSSSDEDLDSKTSQESDGYSEATKCGICGLGFTRTSDYIRHMENSSSHPETRKVWPCEFCDKTLGRRDALMRHVRTFHPGEDGFNPEGVPKGSLSAEAVSVQRMGQRKMPMRRRVVRKETPRRYR